jgi:hypothetical protein
MEKLHTTFLRRFCLMLALTALCLGSMASDLKKFFKPEQIAKANTGKNAEFMNGEEKETLTLINLARLYPRQFLKLYMDYAGSMAVSGNTYYTSLTKDLKTMEPCGALLPDKAMYESAKCWATEAGKEGIVGHDRKNCAGYFNGECCSYGSGTGLDIVMQLLIDDGVKSLGHRHICLDRYYTLVGISLQPHKTYGVNAVLDFTYDRTNNFYSRTSAQKKIKKAAAKSRAAHKTAVKKKTAKTSSTSKIAAKNATKKSAKQSATAKNKTNKKLPQNNSSLKIDNA